MRCPAIILLACFFGGCALPPKESALQRFEFAEPQMGVPFRLVFYAQNEPSAVAAADAAFARIEELNDILSDYQTDSEISELSRSSEEGSPPVKVSSDLWRVLNAAQKLAHESGGAFDVTVGPCVALWRKARREQQMPDPARLENARRKVGYQNLVLDPRTRTAQLLKFGMRLDVGGIAKGYAADEALRVLRSRGIRSALVAASGDLALGDAPPGAKGWSVELTGATTNVVLLANCGVATSGDLYQRLEIGGVRYSHILDPFTCVGMTNQALATIVAEDCMTADMLATPCTILPPDEGLKLCAKYRAAARILQVKEETPVSRENRRFRNLLRN